MHQKVELTPEEFDDLPIGPVAVFAEKLVAYLIAEISRAVESGEFAEVKRSGYPHREECNLERLFTGICEGEIGDRLIEATRAKLELEARKREAA